MEYIFNQPKFNKQIKNWNEMYGENIQGIQTNIANNEELFQSWIYYSKLKKCLTISYFLEME